jgi:hypothetical protein
MKTKIKVETVTQPLFKVHITNQICRQGWFLINADNEAAALLEAKKAYPTYKIGHCYECLENQTIVWF